MVVILDGHGDENVGACWRHTHDGEPMRVACADSYGRAQDPCPRVRAWRNRPLLYVCAPFRTRTEAEAEATDHVLRVAVARGWAPIFAPYCFRGIFSDEKPEEREAMLSVAQGVIQKCAAFYLVGQRVTEGMLRDIAAWEKHYDVTPIFDSLEGTGAGSLPDITKR